MGGGGGAISFTFLIAFFFFLSTPPPFPTVHSSSLSTGRAEATGGYSGGEGEGLLRLPGPLGVLRDPEREHLVWESL